MLGRLLTSSNLVSKSVDPGGSLISSLCLSASSSLPISVEFWHAWPWPLAPKHCLPSQRTRGPAQCQSGHYPSLCFQLLYHPWTSWVGHPIDSSSSNHLQMEIMQEFASIMMEQCHNSCCGFEKGQDKRHQDYWQGPANHPDTHLSHLEFHEKGSRHRAISACCTLSPVLKECSISYLIID